LSLILILLTACSGGVESNFSVTNDGIDWPKVEPQFFADDTFTREVTLIDHAGIRLEAVGGEIEIEGRDDVDSVTVIAHKWVGSDSLEDAEEHLDELEILVTEEMDEVLIQTLQPENTQGRKYIVDYQIILPSDLEIEVISDNGDISVQDVENLLTVDAENGDVFLSSISANVDIDLGNGSIDSTMVLPVDGEMEMSIENGDIELSIPTSTSAEFSASVGNGSISTYNLEFDGAVETNQSLAGTLGFGDGEIDLEAMNGHISVVGYNDGFEMPAEEHEFLGDETFSTELPLENHMGIRLEAVRGDIEIEGRDDVDTVTVIAQKWVGSDSLEDLEADLSELEILVTDQIDEVLIQTLQSDDTQGRDYIVDYQIILPNDLEIEVTFDYGNISVVGVQNRLMVDAVKGNVFLSNMSASVDISLANGRIESTMDLPLFGEIRMSIDNGDIDLSLPTLTSAEFSASIGNGWIRTSNLEFDAPVHTTQSLIGTLGFGEGEIDLGVVNGNISVVCSD
jgi:DUF4097 and DUF4098 domain-containing protein YvlB